MTKELFRELEIAKILARQAGQAILETSFDYSVAEKRGWDGFATPVTSADLQANRIICEGLKEAFPDDTRLSEESSGGIAWHEAERVWIIDPLDGTECFIQGGKDFGVHMGLTVRGEPALGVNYYPVTDVMYWAVRGQGAWKQQGASERVQLLPQRSDGEVVLLPLKSRSDDAFEKLLGFTSSPAVYLGSTGLRLCAIAEGSYNIYIASAKRAGLWDFLSGEVILRETGCFIFDWDGQSIDYRRKDTRLPRGVIVCGNRQIYDSMAAQLKLCKI